MSELEDLERRMLSEAAKVTTVQDMSTIAVALKTIAEARTALSSELTGRRAYVLEVIKSLSTFLVPIVSLLALGATVIVQTKQIEATRQQAENSEWRDLMSSLKGEPGSLVVKDVTIAPRLTSFSTSSIYGDQAKAISIRLMGRLSNPDGFEDLFSYVFPSVTTKNFSSVLDIGRALTKTKKALENQCLSVVQEFGESDPYNILWGCGLSLTDKEFVQIPIKSDIARKKIENARQSIKDVHLEAYFLSQQLNPFLRELYGNTIDRSVSQSGVKLGLDFSNLYIIGIDLSNIDLSQWDISHTIFDFVNFTNSNLSPPKVDGSEFRGSNWWDVAQIQSDLLISLIQWSYPYIFAGMKYPVDIDKENYIKKIRALCTLALAACPSEVKFGPS